MRRQQLVARLHRLGARATFELIDALACRYGLDEQIDQQLERYAGLDPRILAALGADRFPAAPLHVVGGRR